MIVCVSTHSPDCYLLGYIVQLLGNLVGLHVLGLTLRNTTWLTTFQQYTHPHLFHLDSLLGS